MNLNACNTVIKKRVERDFGDVLKLNLVALGKVDPETWNKNKTGFSMKGSYREHPSKSQSQLSHNSILCRIIARLFGRKINPFLTLKCGQMVAVWPGSGHQFGRYNVLILVAKQQVLTTASRQLCKL